MAWIGGFILVLGFLLFLKVFKVVNKSRDVIEVAKISLSTVRNKELSDLEKEKIMQKNAMKMFPLFLWISIGSILALLIPMALVWLLEQIGIMKLDEVIQLSLSWLFIGVSLVVSVLIFWIWKIKNKK